MQKYYEKAAQYDRAFILNMTTFSWLQQFHNIALCSNGGSRKRQAQACFPGGENAIGSGEAEDKERRNLQLEDEMRAFSAPGKRGQ